MAGTMVARRLKGQVFPLVALSLGALLVLIMAALSYGVLTARLMDTLGATQLAAHAGAMAIHVLPDGRYQLANSERVARDVFAQHRLPYASLESVTCGLDQGRPWCEVAARVEGVLLAPGMTVHSRAILVPGITREGQ